TVMPTWSCPLLPPPKAFVLPERSRQTTSSRCLSIWPRARRESRTPPKSTTLRRNAVGRRLEHGTAVLRCHAGIFCGEPNENPPAAREKCEVFHTASPENGRTLAGSSNGRAGSMSNGGNGEICYFCKKGKLVRRTE